MQTKTLIRHPGFRSGRYYGPARTSVASAVLVAGDVYAFPFLVSRRVTISKLATYLVTGVAATEAKFGVYANDDVNGGIGAILGQTAGVATTGSGVDIEGDLSLTLEPGWYWFAAISNGAPTLAGISTTDQIVSGLVGGPTASSVLRATTSTQVAGVKGANVSYASGLPATFGTDTPVIASPTPSIAFKVA